MKVSLVFGKRVKDGFFNVFYLSWSPIFLNLFPMPLAEQHETRALQYCAFFLAKKINHKVQGLYFLKLYSHRAQIMCINIANVFAVSLCDTLFL